MKTHYSPRNQYLVISAIGQNPIELTNALCRACLESRCSVVNSRLTRHEQHSALVVQAGGSWDALARLEVSLPNIAKRENIHLTVVRTEQQNSTEQALPYIVYVNALYRPDILAELCQFFSDQQINLENIAYESYIAPQTQTMMLNATITVTLPITAQISWIRDQFLDFADSLNLDALIEPWRPQLI